MRKEFWDVSSDERCAACKVRPATRTFVASPAGQTDLHIAQVCDDCHATLVNAFLREIGADDEARVKLRRNRAV